MIREQDFHHISVNYHRRIPQILAIYESMSLAERANLLLMDRPSKLTEPEDCKNLRINERLNAATLRLDSLTEEENQQYDLILHAKTMERNRLWMIECRSGSMDSQVAPIAEKSHQEKKKRLK